MKKSLLALASKLAIRARTCDVAMTYRMGAGSAGDINRTHPFSCPPGLINATVPPKRYGDPAYIDTASNAYKGFVAGDTAKVIMDGILVRPYPTQQVSTSQGLGAGDAPLSGVADFLEDGYIMVKCNVGVPTKRGAVFIWCAVDSGNHKQGGFEAAATGGSTAAIANAYFNGPPDANGITEIRIWNA